MIKASLVVRQLDKRDGHYSLSDQADREFWPMEIFTSRSRLHKVKYY